MTTGYIMMCIIETKQSPLRSDFVMSRSLLPVLTLILSLSAALCDPAIIQRRIALNPTGMTVSFSTVGQLADLPMVIYGTSPQTMNATAKGETLHYVLSATYFHHVPLTNLLSATRYYWSIISEPSNILSFMTAPNVSALTSFRTIIYGDLGIDNSENTLNRLHLIKKSINNYYDFIYHIGDLSYADDYLLTRFTYEQITEQWMTNMTSLWNEQPYMVLPGNHEWTCSEIFDPICPASQRNFTSYRLRFYMPHDQSVVPSPTNMFYSFDYSYAHFISVDTETYPGGPEDKNDVGPFGDQATWLEQDLLVANVNRAVRPWIIVGGHRPYFSSNGGSDAQVKFFAALFVKYGVDIVFVGHLHWYERLYALSATGEICTKSYTNPSCPIYIVTGAAGNIEGLTKSINPQPITAKIISEFGIGQLTIQNSTTALWEFINSENGQIEDSIIISKNRQLQQEQLMKNNVIAKY